VGFIEADIFLVNDKLMVAHHDHEIEVDKTLKKLYLEPLKEKINRNGGTVYSDSSKSLTLMIDLKTEGVSTLKRLVSVLEKFPQLTACRTLRIMISGNVPDPGSWDDYPLFIYFDGRPNIVYSANQLKRVSMISTSFRNHSNWDGAGSLPDADEAEIRALMEEAHLKGKPMRFWATPDSKNAWVELMKLKVDVIVTDDVTGLSDHLKKQRNHR
jgi:alkaline phosphatase